VGPAVIPEGRTLSPDRVGELTRSGDAELIDVRTGVEHEAGHVPGDRHLPFDALSEEAATLAGDRALIFYCRSGERSEAAAEAFAASGRDAYSMEGGLLAWAEAGRPVEPKGGEVAILTSLPSG
jgi:rhodanese-related sulfurtransferase